MDSLDPFSQNVKDYLIFLDLIDVIKERFTEDDDVTSRLQLTKLYDWYQNGELVKQMFDGCRDIERLDELIYDLKNNIYVMRARDKEYTVLVSVLESLLSRVSISMSKGDNTDLDKLTKMMINYTKQYVEEYSDKYDEIITIILKIAHLQYEDNGFWIKKQDMLRQAILFCQNDEIIETLGNFYIDLLSGETKIDFQELIQTFLVASENIDQLRIEQNFLGHLCNNENDLEILEQCHKMLEIDEKSMSAFKLLQKAMFLCKNNTKSVDDSRYNKTKNLIDCIKRKDKVITDDMIKVSEGDPYFCLNYRINKSVNQTQSMINDDKIQK